MAGVPQSPPRSLLSRISGRGKLLLLVGFIGYILLDALDHTGVIPDGIDKAFVQFVSRMAELIGGVGAAQWITELADRVSPKSS